jgi:hypothetical protein
LLRGLTLAATKPLRLKRRRSRNARAACQSANPTQHHDELLAPTTAGACSRSLTYVGSYQTAAHQATKESGANQRHFCHCNIAAAVHLRRNGGRGFKEQTTVVLEQWPSLARSSRYQVRQPVALDQSGGTR